MLLWDVIQLSVVLLTCQQYTQTLAHEPIDTFLPPSPCPSVFSYEARTADKGRWSGIVLVATDTPLTGVRLDITLSRSAWLLGNWLGAVHTDDNTHFTILSLQTQVVPGPPLPVKVFVRFDELRDTPVLEGIALNGRAICPQGQETASRDRPPSRDVKQPSLSTGGSYDVITKPSVLRTTATTNANSYGETHGPSPIILSEGGSGNSDNAYATVTKKTFLEDGGYQVRNTPSPMNQFVPTNSPVPYGRNRATTTRPQRQHQRPQEETQRSQQQQLWPQQRPQQQTQRTEQSQQTPLGQKALQQTQRPQQQIQTQQQSQQPQQMQQRMEQVQQGGPGQSQDQEVHTIYAKQTTQRPTSLTITSTDNRQQESKPGYKNNNINNGNNSNKGPRRSPEHLPTITTNMEWMTTPNTAAATRERHREYTTTPSGECGSTHVSATPLITHAHSTRRGQWPWHTALYKSKGADLTYVCGGSLLTLDLVLTAAHCVARPVGNLPVDPDNIVVYLGKYHLKLWSEGGVQNKQVAHIHIHPEYNNTDFRSDLAVIILSSPVQYTQYVRPVCLWPGSSVDLRDIEGKEGYVVGWGYDEHNVVSEDLRMAKMPVVSQQTCLYSYPEFFSHFTNNRTFCAGFKNGTSVCNGDSGGGMVFPIEQSDGRKRWYLRGVVSVSVSLEERRVCDPTHYVVFTDVGLYKDWLSMYM